jgi:hypothetical protein
MVDTFDQHLPHSLINYGKDRQPGETMNEFDCDIVYVGGQFID